VPEAVFVRSGRTSVMASVASVTLNPLRTPGEPCFHARTGGHARENNLRHTFASVELPNRCSQSAPGAFGDEDVVLLRMQFGIRFMKVGKGTLGAVEAPLSSPERSRNVDQNTGSFCLRKASIS